MAHQNSKCCHKWYTTTGNFLLIELCLAIKECSQLQNLKVGTAESEKVTIMPELENAAQQKDKCSSYIWYPSFYFPVSSFPTSRYTFFTALLIPLPLVFILPIPSSSPIFSTVANTDGSSHRRWRRDVIHVFPARVIKCVPAQTALRNKAHGRGISCLKFVPIQEMWKVHKIKHRA